MAVYVTPVEFLKRFDARDVGDLVADDGVQVTPTALLTDANLTACILDASGDIDSALLAGGLYLVADLEGLTENSLGKLYRICSEITMCYLLERRPDFDEKKLEAYEKLRDRHLKRLRNGENVFLIQLNIDAGKADVDGPTTQQYQDLNLFRDRMQNYYPARHLPGNR